MDKIRTVSTSGEKYYNIDDIGIALNIDNLRGITRHLGSHHRTQVITLFTNDYMLTKRGARYIIDYHIMNRNNIPADLIKEFFSEENEDTKNSMDVQSESTKAVQLENTKESTKDAFLRNMEAVFPDEDILLQYGVLGDTVDAYLPKRKLVIDFVKLVDYDDSNRIDAIKEELGCTWLTLCNSESVFTCISEVMRCINTYNSKYISNLYSDNDSNDKLVENIRDMLHNFADSDDDVYHLSEDVLTTALNHTVQMCKMRTVLGVKFLNQF